MVFTTEHEREIDSDATYIACFRGSNLRRTLIVAGCYCMQVLSGTTLRSYASTYARTPGIGPPEPVLAINACWI
jgi:MFS transporter, SP family, general alpha glucoside:H+ symporter